MNLVKLFLLIEIKNLRGIGDWGLGIGDWGLGNPHVLSLNII